MGFPHEQSSEVAVPANGKLKSPHRRPKTNADGYTHFNPLLLVHVVSRGGPNAAVAEMLAGGFDAEGRGDKRAAFLTQRVNCLLLAHALGPEPRVEVTPSAVASIVVVGCRRIMTLAILPCMPYVVFPRRDILWQKSVRFRSHGSPSAGYPFFWRGIPAVPLVTLIRAPAPPPQLPH